jgi:hypothetical protein
MECCIFPFCASPVAVLGPFGWTCDDHEGQVPTEAW